MTMIPDPAVPFPKLRDAILRAEQIAGALHQSDQLSLIAREEIAGLLETLAAVARVVVPVVPP